MPGLVGVALKQSGPDLSQIVERMVSAISYNDSDKRDTYVEQKANLALGRVHLGVLNDYPQPLASDDGQISVVLDGELYRNKSGKNDAELMLDLYREQGDLFIDHVEGVFNFLVYDRPKNVLKIYNDHFGLLPLYYTLIDGGTLALCTEVKGVLQVPGVDRTRDDSALADCLTFGYPLGNRSLFQSIRLLEPASILSFDLETRELSRERYWDSHDLFVPQGMYSETITDEDVVDTLVEAVRKRSVTHRDRLGLSLSGGLDTRSILAAMMGDAKGVKSYTLGLKGCQDEAFAAGIAKVAGTDHMFVELGATYLDSFENIASLMIHLSDGMYFPQEATEILALEHFKTGRYKVLLRGHGGEMAKASLAYPPMVDPGVVKLTRRYDVLTSLYHKVNLVTPDINPRDLFAPEFYERCRNAAFTDLEATCGRAVDTMAPADVFLFYYLDAYIRRFGVHSLSIFKTQIEVRMPYVDRGFLDALLKIPPHRRWAGEIHRQLVARCQPGMTKVPDSNTGAPLDAGPVRLFVIDKATAVLRKLSVAGFRHYTEFQKWQREQFRDDIERIIFSTEAKERGIFNMAQLRNIFQRHVAGVGEYGHLLGTAVGIELWHRQFVD